MTPHDIAIEAVTRMAYPFDPTDASVDWESLRKHVALAMEMDDTSKVRAYQAVLSALRQEREIAISVVTEVAKAAGAPLLGRVVAEVLRKRGEASNDTP